MHKYVGAAPCACPRQPKGNSLTLKETQIAIEEEMTMGSHLIHEHLEATNHTGAYDLLCQLNLTINPPRPHPSSSVCFCACQIVLS